MTMMETKREGLMQLVFDLLRNYWNHWKVFELNKSNWIKPAERTKEVV